MKISMTIASLAVGAGLLLGVGAPSVLETKAEAKEWYPYKVDVWPALKMLNRRKIQGYVPLERATKKWKLCVAVPRMNNPFWDAVNYGVVDQARHLGVAMEWHAAGGYGNEPKQIAQIKRCVADGIDALIVGAITPDGLVDLVSEIRAKGIPVINLATELLSEELSAKSLVSFGERAWYLGEYILKRHPKGGKTVKVAWLTDPGEPGWVFSQHFTDVTSDGAIEIIEPSADIRVGPIEDIIADHPDIRYVAANPGFALAAVRYLKQIGRLGDIEVMTYDIPPPIYDGLASGEITAATTDSPVIQGRIAVDQAVRILEGVDYLLHVGPYHFVIDATNFDDVDRNVLLAPAGYKPVTRVE